MRKGFLLLSLFLAVGSFRIPTVRAYEEVEVTNGGTIVGEVLFTGQASKPATLAVTKNQEFCGESKPDESLIVGANKGVKNAIVTIENIAKGKKIDKTAQPSLDNNGCRFIPHVQAVNVGTTLEIRNSDPILHNTHSFLQGSTVFNLALPLKGQKVRKPLRLPGLIDVKCDAGHTWMRAYILVAENPYFAVSDDAGKFQIEDVPAGKYKLKAWHEKLGTEIAEVEVQAGKESKVSFSNLRP